MNSGAPSHQSLPDAALLRGIACGDEAAFEVFVERYKPSLWRYLFHRIGDAHRAEDLLQETFLRTFRAARRGAAATDVRAWVFAIAHNSAADHFRERQRRPLNFGGDTTPPEPVDSWDPLREAMAAESTSVVQALLSGLPAEQRDVVTLRVFGELTFDQIACVMSAPLATVKSRMRYAVIKLRNHLAEDLK